jgi:hypothetical protein
MSETKTYVFGNEGAGSLNALLPFLQQRGIDSSYLLGLMGNNNGGFFGNNALEGIIALIVVAAIFGNGNFGFGGFGGNGNAVASSTERELLANMIQRNGVDLSQLSQSINCSSDRLDDAIGQVSTQLCNFAGQNGLSFQSVINSIQAGDASIASQLCDCCCSIKGAIADSKYATERGFCDLTAATTRGFSDVGYALRDQTCNLEKSIADSTAQILAGQAAIEKRELQREIATLQDEKQTYKLGNMMTQANAPLAAAINALQSDVDGIKCRLPKTEVIPATPDYVQVNRSINIPYGPYCGYGAFGANYGFGCANGWNGGSLWG